MHTVDCEVFHWILYPVLLPIFIDFQNEAVSLCINNLNNKGVKVNLYGIII